MLGFGPATLHLEKFKRTELTTQSNFQGPSFFDNAINKELYRKTDSILIFAISQAGTHVPSSTLKLYCNTVWQFMIEAAQIS